ncbi:MAG: hypothetical protein HY842_09100 [Bacteroidetes bacterium]|nr:hypothetical protein [Bacteroidota bacterium]
MKKVLTRRMQVGLPKKVVCLSKTLPAIQPGGFAANRGYAKSSMHGEANAKQMHGHLK